MSPAGPLDRATAKPLNPPRFRTYMLPGWVLTPYFGLRARPIRSDDDTRPGRLRGGELQPFKLTPALEKTFAIARDDRVNHELKFVEEVLLQK